MREEIQAIVLAAGPGMRMTTLTNSTAKCLLPLGTLPMIYYPLYFLQEAGFKEVTVVVSGGVEGKVRKLVEQYDLKLKLDITNVNTSDDPGTADSLRHIANKIKKNVDDVVIVSSDMITDAKFQPMLTHHHESGAALTMLTANQDEGFTRATAPGPKAKSNISSDIICVENGTDRLLYSVAGGDYDDTITLSNRVMSSMKSTLEESTKLLDAHLYIMKRWLIDYILHEESPCRDMGSLKAEIIPHIIKNQFTKMPTKAKGERKYCIHDAIEKDPLDDLILKYNTSTVLSRYNNSSALDERVCYSYHHPGICVRTNTINAYWEVNRLMHSLFEKVCPGSPWHLQHPLADIQQKAQISDDTVVGTSSVICPKTNIKSSVIGNHCRINSYVRTTNAVLVDHITIAEGCVIENSLICANIEKKCTFKNCIVTDSSRIEEDGQYVNEVLEASQDYIE